MNESKNEHENGVGLSLSGGGFRASLFHLGSLLRLNELGYLKKLTCICSVSGGSITSATLAMNWERLKFDENDVAANISECLVEPVRSLCSKSLDVKATLFGWITPGQTTANELAGYYEKYLFGKKTLQDLPDDTEAPRFIFYSTSLQTGASVRFQKDFLREYHLGQIPDPTIPLSIVVAASSAFPPLFTPLTLQLDPDKWQDLEGADLFHDANFKERLLLTDGGVYDNLGLEAIWHNSKSYPTVLVSDAGRPKENVSNYTLLNFRPITKMKRVLDITMEQVRALRVRRLIDDYKDKERKGTYWGIGTKIDDYNLDALVEDNNRTGKLKETRTRLNAFNDTEQGDLINWGYALTDAAMRAYVDEEATIGKWPVPDYRLDR